MQADVSCEPPPFEPHAVPNPVSQGAPLALPSGTPEHRLLLSVVIPTYRRPELLQRCLSALLDQSLDPGRYEILVVDDEPSTATQAAVAKAALVPFPTVRYFKTSGRRGPAAARNMGWRAARAPIIAFTDDDCIPLREWLSEGARALEEESLAGVWGQIVVPLPPKPTDHELNTKGLERSPCATANCFYRKEALADVGGFDERFTAAWREDSDLQFMLLERGSRLAPCQEAVVLHPARPAAWGISLRQQRNNLFNALLYKKHPRLYRERLQPRPPWRYYATVAALLGTAGAAMLQSAPWMMAGAGAWAALTGDFCRRRLQYTSRHLHHVVEMLITSALIPPLAIFWRLRGAWRYRVPFL